MGYIKQTYETCQQLLKATKNYKLHESEWSYMGNHHADGGGFLGKTYVIYTLFFPPKTSW